MLAALLIAHAVVATLLFGIAWGLGEDGRERRAAYALGAGAVSLTWPLVGLVVLVAMLFATVSERRKVAFLAEQRRKVARLQRRASRGEAP